VASRFTGAQHPEFGGVASPEKHNAGSLATSFTPNPLDIIGLINNGTAESQRSNHCGGGTGFRRAAVRSMAIDPSISLGFLPALWRRIHRP